MKRGEFWGEADGQTARLGPPQSRSWLLCLNFLSSKRLFQSQHLIRKLLFCFKPALRPFRYLQFTAVGLEPGPGWGPHPCPSGRSASRVRERELGTSELRIVVPVSFWNLHVCQEIFPIWEVRPSFLMGVSSRGRPRSPGQAAASLASARLSDQARRDPPGPRTAGVSTALERPSMGLSSSLASPGSPVTPPAPQQ